MVEEIIIPEDLANLYANAVKDSQRHVPRIPYAKDVVKLIELIAQLEQSHTSR